MKDRLGALSLGIGALLLLVHCLAWAVFTGVAIGRPGSAHGAAGSTVLSGLGLFAIASLLGHVLACALGVAAVVRKEKPAIVGILGVALNALVLLAVVAIFLLGLLGISA